MTNKTEILPYVPKDGELPKFTPSQDQLDLIQRVRNRQQSMEMSDGEFCKEHLPFTATVWGRILTGQYWYMVESGDRILAELAATEDGIERAQAMRERYGNPRFVNHTAAQAVWAAIDDCRSRPTSNPQRLVVYLAPTRGGKTWICFEAVKRYGAKYVQTRERHAHSYYTFLRDLCCAFGCINSKAFLSKAAMEEKLVARLSGTRHYLVFDEGEFFAAESLNLIKYLLNTTNVVVLLAAIPLAYERWSQRFPHESEQILARSEAVIELAPITGEQALVFLKHCKLEHREKCGEVAAAFANAFGHFQALAEMAARFEPGSQVGPSDIIKRGNDRRKKWRLAPLGGFEKQHPA